MQEQVQEQGLPLLKDIPLLGNLFKRQSSSRQRTELAIFVTPYIVRSDAEADAIRDRIRRRMESGAPGALDGTPAGTPAGTPPTRRPPPR